MAHRELPPLSRRTIATIRKLRLRKYREETGMFVLEGFRLVRDVLQTGMPLKMIVFETAKVDRFDSLIDIAAAEGIPMYGTTPDQFKELADTRHSQGILAIAQRKRHAPEQLLDQPIAVYLHEVADPGNLGTLLRTSDWFGIRSVLLSPGSVDVTNPKTVRASMGSIARVRTAEIVDAHTLLDISHRLGYVRAALVSAGGTPLASADRPPKLLLLFGGESRGLPQDLLDQCDMQLTIEGNQSAESLNLAVAHGIALDHFFTRL